MNKKIVFTSLIIIILNLCGCDNSNGSSVDDNQQIASLQAQINQLQNTVNQLSNEIPTNAIFTPGSKGYNAIHTFAGEFLVSLSSLKKYADGYRATFSVMTPGVMIFANTNVQISWGKAYDANENYNAWTNSLKSENIAINKQLLPGRWNTFSVVLSPASAKETGYISLSLIPNLVSPVTN